MASLSILIVGCGIAGPTLASFLLLADIPAAQKPRITILERESNQKAHLRGQNIDIRGAGVTIIRKLGLEAQIRASTTGEEGVRMVDESYRIWTENPADRTGTIQTGTSDIEILRGKLAELCWKNSQRISAAAQREGAAGIEYIFGDSLEDIQQHGSQVHVRFAKSGKTRSFDLLVGADGMQSRTRKMVWGEEGENNRLKRLGMFAGFFSIPREEHDDNWRRWFHAPGRRGIMLRPDGLGMRSTILMYVVNDKDPRFVDVATKGSGGIQEQKALLEEYFHGAGWECDRIIREMKATDDFYYDAVSQVKMDRWSKGRVVLLGDAGYCASPISGLGTTLAFSAAYKLAGYLQPYIKGESPDLSSALAQYDEQMRPIVEDAQQLAPGMPHLINPETAWGIWTMRSLILALSYTRTFFYIIKLFGRIFHLGPQAANYVAVEDFGFKDMAVWEVRNTAE
ncbi:oxidoreductase [Aspergillus vadensis CBS 113365]|uniref:Oxidoreductase n=1 Tax=Aspergillus vadensis (strain CBS 113365 / IMI 142717 / IBT 24658) TaxID=1448311 RepID=A0A319AVJ6_ASPVC|nr:oxidoreductase [Aspergillus vadensis CBS 113365]PYH63715.1 oxidoreductase [Aspergillus vadensis CBS 113365]